MSKAVKPLNMEVRGGSRTKILMNSVRMAAAVKDVMAV